MTKEKSLPKNSLVGMGLNDDGSEIVDTTVRSVGLRGPIKSAEQKLKEMMDRELERRARREEQVIDSYDFELEDDSVMLHGSVEVNPPSARELREAYREQKQFAKQKAARYAAAEETEGPTGGPQSTAKSKQAKSKDSARASANEVAESEEEDQPLCSPPNG